MLEYSRRLGALAPGIVHGFTTRMGGHSRGRYASLNMSGHWGDEPDAVERNLETVARVGKFRLSWLTGVRQVHGAVVLRATDVGPGAEADGLWCHRDDGPCVVRVLTADCVPVLLADREGQVVAAVHSGWRGTVAGVVNRAVQALAAAGVGPDRLIAAVGPCIECSAFEVGEEVAAHFDEAFVDRTRGAKPYVDLVGSVRGQLESEGVPPDAIERVGGCTYGHPDRYFSYRRDGRGIGQMMSWIGIVDPESSRGSLT